MAYVFFDIGVAVMEMCMSTVLFGFNVLQASYDEM